MKLDDVKDKVIELRMAGHGAKRIAKELGVAESSVKRWFIKLNLPRRLEARIIECKECRKSTEVTRDNAMYCSDACRQIARKIKANGRKKCKRCNEPVRGLQNVECCSDDCRNKYKLSKRTIRLVVNTCACCGKDKVMRYKRKFCSDNCREIISKGVSKRWYKENSKRILDEKLLERIFVRQEFNRKCKECGRHFVTSKSNRIFCAKSCVNKYHYRKKDILRREKIIANGKVDWSISIERLTKRDGKVCYLCNVQMNYQEDYNHQDYPSIEHIKPVSKGGTHTWDNVKLAHRKCNVEKSDVWIE